MKLYRIGGLALAAAIACSDVTAPVNRGLQVPRTVNRTVNGPPDVTFTINSLPGVSVALTSFAHDTWVTLEATGLVSFTSLSPAPGASPYYQYPGASVDARGVYDFRINDASNCALRLWVGGPSISSSTFGDCTAGQLKVDTTKLVGPATLKRGLSPYQNSYDCDPWGTAVCHTVPDASQSVRLRPIPVTLNTPKPSKRAWNFAAGQADIIFTASRTPDSLTIAGARTPMPVTMKLWQWIGADSTRLGVTGYCGNGAFPNCHFYPMESGRMVTKGYTGGWEQTSSVTVQCLASPTDPAVNDSTSGFNIREDLLEVLVTSNADSLPEAGWNGSQLRGYRHESGGVIWQLPNGGGFVFVPYEDPLATQGSYHLPDSELDLARAPVPGATPYATVHSHPNNPDDDVYGATYRMADGALARFARFPGDSLPDGSLRRVPTKAKDNPTHAGSSADWKSVRRRGNLPDIIVAKEGFVFRLNVPGPTGPEVSWPYRTKGGTAAERKCAWVKKYKP